MASERQELEPVFGDYSRKISKSQYEARKIIGAGQGFFPSDEFDEAWKKADLPAGVPRNDPDTNVYRHRAYRMIEERGDLWLSHEAAVTDGAFHWESGMCKIDDATGIAVLIFAPSNEHGAMAIRCAVSFFNRTANPLVIRFQLDRLAEQMMTEYFRHKGKQ